MTIIEAAVSENKQNIEPAYGSADVMQWKHSCLLSYFYQAQRK